MLGVQLGWKDVLSDTQSYLVASSHQEYVS